MKKLFVVFFSAGWLLPFWAAVVTMLDFVKAEALPRWKGQDPVNSFPFISFSREAFTVACIWLALVLAYWAWRGYPQGQTHSAS